MIVRRDIELLITSLVLGPLLGAFVFLGTIVMVGGLPSIGSVLPLLLFGSYVLGALPAGLNSVATSIASRLVPRALSRIALSPLTGAASAIAVLGWLLLQGDPGAIPPALVLGLMALSGAIASLVCVALIERFGAPLPAQKGATT